MLVRGFHCHIADLCFAWGIEVDASDADSIAVVIACHDMKRLRIPVITLAAPGLIPGFAQQPPAQIKVALELLFGLGSVD